MEGRVHQVGNQIKRMLSCGRFRERKTQYDPPSDLEIRFERLTSPVKWRIISVLLLLFFTGCFPAGEMALPLDGKPYTHPSGIFSIPIPEGWHIVAGDNPHVVWLKPPDEGSDVAVVLIAEVLAGANETEMSQTAQSLLESYIQAYLPYDDYEIYNQAEVRVARNPALILDIARPAGDSFHTARLELIYLPGNLVFLGGYGSREAWDDFLPTFRQMVEGMTFTIQPFPVEE